MIDKDLIVNEFIECILKSPLNIDTIPDDIERQLYRNLYDILEKNILNQSLIQQVCNWFRSLCHKKTE